jgi:hypothetical protein
MHPGVDVWPAVTGSALLAVLVAALPAVAAPRPVLTSAVGVPA